MKTKSAGSVLSFGVVVILLSAGSDSQLLGPLNNILGPLGLSQPQAGPPKDLGTLFPYYISGLDYKGQPVMVFEYGKWKVSEYFNSGGDSNTLDAYIDQLLYRWGMAEKNLPPNENNTGTGFYGLIVDMEGYDITQLIHVPTTTSLLRMTTSFMAPGGAGSKMDYAFLINMNYIAETLVSTLIAPILAQLFSRVEVGGTNMAEWVPKMLSKIPKESLPMRYGGSVYEFKPLVFYG